MPHPRPRAASPTLLVWAALSIGDHLPHAQAEIEALRRLQIDGLCTTIVKIDAAWPELPVALLEHEPDIFHFIGHGDWRGNLLLNDQGALDFSLGSRDLVHFLRQAPHGGPEGVYLNACWSSSHGPHLTPDGGWALSMDRSVDDDVAALFAETFYRNLLSPTHTPSVADVVRLTQANLLTTGGRQNDLVQSCWFEQSLARVDDEQDVEASQFIRAVFNRNAFRIPAVEELTLDTLRVALNDTAMALPTGRLVTRDPRETYRHISLAQVNTPEIARFTETVTKALNRLRSPLETLGREFPDFSHSEAAAVTIPTQDLPRALGLLDDVDRARNHVLDIVNRFLTTHHLPPFAEIPLSSSTAFGRHLTSRL